MASCSTGGAAFPARRRKSDSQPVAVMKIEIISDRFIARELGVEDVTERYLSWLRDPDAKKYIAAASATDGLSDLKRYVQERINRKDVLFLGIFDKSTGKHVGNIKYEPIDDGLGYAVMGLLIGDPAYRGSGVTPEILKSTAQWLREHRNIKQIVLGVSKDNHRAIRAYEKAGFTIASTPYIPHSADSLTMVWEF